METGVAIIQEPVFSKTSVEEAPAGVILDHSSMEVDKLNLSTVLGDEITSRGCGNNTVPGEADGAEKIVNGSGNKETDESEGEKGEAMKTISVVEDSKIVKEAEKDEQGSIFVHEPVSFNENTDAKIMLSDVTLEQAKEEVSVEKPVIEEDQTETKHTPEQEVEIGEISKVLIDTEPIKLNEGDAEKSLDSAREEIPIKADEVKEEKDSRTVETSVNGTEAEHNGTVSVEEVSRNGESIAKKTAPKEETATDGESLDDVEDTKGVLLEAETEARVDAKEKKETAHESESLKGDDHQRETIKHSEDAEQVSREEDITKKREEAQESLMVIETPKILGEDTEEHEHVLVRDIPQGETLVTEAETRAISTVQESAILKTDAEPSLDLKVDKEQEEAETVKTVIASDEVQESIEAPQSSEDTEEDEHVLRRNMPQSEIFVTEAETLETKEDTKPIMDLKEDKEQESVEVESKETVQDKITKEKHENLLDVPSTESEKYQDKELETVLVADTESREKFEDIPSDLASKVDKEELKDDKLKADQFDGTQTMEEQRGLDSNDQEVEKIDRNKTEDIPSLPDVESVEQLQKPSLESHSEVSEETSTTVDEKIKETPEEEVPQHQEDQEEGSNKLVTTEETVSVVESREIGEKSQEETNVSDLTPLQEESCLPNEKEYETKLQKEEAEKHEPRNKEVTNAQQTLAEEKCDEVDGTQIVEEQRGLDLKDPEAEQIDRNRTDETEETPTDEAEETTHSEALPDVISVEKMEKPSLESLSAISEETSKTVDEKMEEKTKEEVTLHQESKEGDSCGLETKEQTVSVPESSELGAKAKEEESCPPNEQEKETNLQKVQIEKHESTSEEDSNAQNTLGEEKADEVIQVSSASASEEREGEDVSGALKIEDTKANEEEDAAERIQKSLETVETTEPHSSLPSSSEKQEDKTVAEAEKIEDEKLEAETTGDMSAKGLEIAETTDRNLPFEASRSDETESSELEEQKPKQVREILEVDETKEEKLPSSETVPQETLSEEVRSIEKGETETKEPEHVDSSDKNDDETLIAETKKEDEDITSENLEALKLVESKEDKSHEVSETIKAVEPKGVHTLAIETPEACQTPSFISELEDKIPKQIEEIHEDEDITQKTEEGQESTKVIESPVIHGKDIESKASLDHEEESSKDTEEQEHVSVRDMPQVETLVTEAEAVETSTVQESAFLKTLETEEDRRTSLDLKEDKEQEETETSKTVISSDEVRSSNVEAEEFVDVKSRETIQDESSEKHDNLLDEQSGESDKQHQEKEPETVVEGDEITHDLSFPDVESVEKTQKPSFESPSAESEETSKSVDVNIEAKSEELTHHQEGQEEGSSGLETKETTVSAPESSELEESCQTNEQEKETNFQEEQVEKHEPTNEEDLTDQQSHVEEKSDEVIQVSSASHSEEWEGGIAVEAEKIEEIKTNEEEEKSLETVPEDDHHVEKAKPVEAIRNLDDAEKISYAVTGDREKEEEITQQTDEVQETPKVIETPTIQGEDTESNEHEYVLVRDIPQVETLATEAEPVDTSTAQESAIFKTLEAKTDETEAVHSAKDGEEEGREAKEDSEPILDVKTDKEQEEIEAVTTDISSDEVRSSDAKVEEFIEHTEPSSSEINDESHGREESVEVKTTETVQEESSEKNKNLLDDTTKEDEVDGAQIMEEQKGLDLKDPEAEHIDRNITDETEESPIVEAEETTHSTALPDVISVETMEKSSLESPSAISEETSNTVDEKMEEKTKEEVTLHQESKEGDSCGLETKEQTVSVPESSELGAKAKEEESCPPNEQEKETNSQEVHIETHESTSEEDTNAQQTSMEEKADEVIQLSSASPSEEWEGNGVVEAEKIEDIKASEEEQVADKIQRSVETVETDEHETVAEADKIEDEKVKETEPTGDMSEKGLEISETKDMSLPLEASRSDGIESSELAARFEEQKPEQVKEIIEVDETKAEKLPSSVTIPQETLSEENATESHERQEELSKAAETKETTVAQEEQTRDIETSLTEKSSMDQTQPEEQVKEECSRDEQEEVVSTEKGEVKTKEPEHVDSLDKNDDETLIAETKKEDEDITSENVYFQQEDFENLVAPELDESKEDKSQEISETIEAIEAKGDHTLAIETPVANQTPSFISELEDKIPKQIEEIHEEETKEAHKVEVLVAQSLPVETSQEDQTSKLIHEEEDTKESPKVEEDTSGQNLPVETSQADETQSSELVSGLDDQTTNQAEEIHEEETKADKLREEEILPAEIVPRESFSEAPVSMLASSEDDQIIVQEDNLGGDTQEERHISAETEEIKPKESEVERIEKSDDQIETSTKVTKVEDEDTKETDIEVPQSPENACLMQEESKDLGTLQHGEITGEAEHGDETLPVVGILKELHTTLENERAVNDSEAESSGNDLHSIKAEPETLEKNLVADIVEPVTNEKQDKKVAEESPASEIIEANKLQQDESGETENIQEENVLAGKSLPAEELKLQEQHREEVEIEEEIDVKVKEKLQEETNGEIAADQSPAEVLPCEKNLIPASPLVSEELEHVVSAEKQEEREPQQDVNESTAEKLQEEHPRDFETSKKEQNAETHETVKEEDQVSDIKEENKNEEVQDQKLEGISTTRDIEEIFSSKAKKEKEDASELGVGHGFVSPDAEKVEEPHIVLENEEEINEVVTSEKQITDPVGVIVEPQAIPDYTKSNDEKVFPTEQAPDDQREEVTARKSLTKEALEEQLQVPSSTVLDDFQENSKPEAMVDLADRDLSVQKPSELVQSRQSPNPVLEEKVEETSFEVKKAQEDKNEDLITSENVQVQDQSKDFEQEKKSDDLTYVQEDIGSNVKPEARDDEIKGDGHDSVVALKEETCLTEEKKEVEYVKTEPEDEIKHGVSIEEKNNTSIMIDQEATKEIYQEESKQTETVTAIKEQIREEEKETTKECYNGVKNTEDATEKAKPEIENLTSVNDTQEKSKKIEEPKQEEFPNQQKREIADDVPKPHNLKIAEELQQKVGESENNKESEPTVREPARNSLSDLIQNVKGTNKTEDATKETHQEEEPKAEEEDEEGDGDGDNHKDDKTSPDSIVMVEAKDTVTIVKTQHKKSQSILSGVGSKVKHSISKVKKALTGKSSHTTKPSSPK